MTPAELADTWRQMARLCAALARHYADMTRPVEDRPTPVSGTRIPAVLEVPDD